MDPNGMVTVYTQNDGKLWIQWPEGKNAETYQLEIKEQNGTVLYSCVVSGRCSQELPELPTDHPLELKITSSHRYGKKVRLGDQALQLKLQLQMPHISQLEHSADVDTGVVQIHFNMEQGDLCRVYAAVGEGEATLFRELTTGALTINFGEEKDFPIPEYDQPVTLSFQLQKKSGQVFAIVDNLESFTITREHLLGNVLNVQYEDQGANVYTLTWNETKGEHYEVRLSDDGGKCQLVLLGDIQGNA